MIVPRIKPITQKRLAQLKRNAGDGKYREWRLYVLERDGHRCQYPGCDKDDKLQVHHIKKFSKNKHLKTDKLNGISLCEGCHRKIYNKEELYEFLFFNTVLANEKKYISENNS